MSEKIKRGTKLTHPYWGEVTMWHDSGNGMACVDTHNGAEDPYEVVEVSELLEIQKSRTGLKNSPKSKSQYEKDFDAALNKFFLQISYEVPVECQNCGAALNAYSLWPKRCVSAHILPKEHFPELATVEANIMFWGVALFSACSCHSRWDNLDAAARMEFKCHPEVVYRYTHFLAPLLSEPQRIKASKYLGLSESRLSA